jgi:membrane associated rhomboid family serine protease
VRRGSVRASAPFTLAIVVITVAFYVISRVSLDLDEAFIERLAQINILVAEGEWWRLLTVVLLHGSAMHIFFNMWALWQLGPSVEALSGRLPFLTLYLAAAAGGGLLVYLLGNIDDVAIGSSGAIFGLFGVWLYNAYRRRETAFGRAILSQLGFLLLVNAMLPLFFPAISWQGHLGGLLTGILVSALWERRRTEASRAVAAGTVLVALLLLASPLSPLL